MVGKADRRTMPDEPIPQSDPRAGILALRSRIEIAIIQVIESGRYILGREVQGFEQEFSAFVGVSHGIGVANGTDALVLSLRALGLGANDYVVTVSHTAVATVAANGGGHFVVKEFPSERKAIDIGDYWTDDTTFKRITGWQPRIRIRPGLEKSLDFFRTRLAKYV